MPEPIFLQAANRHASALAFFPDGKRLVTGGMEGALKCWTLGKSPAPQEWPGHVKSVNTLSLSIDGSRVATGGSDKRVVIHDAKSGEILETIEGYTSGWYSSDGMQIALAKDRGNVVYIRDLESGKVRGALKTGLKKIGWPVFLPDGRLALAGFGQAVELWNTHEGQMTGSLEGHGTSVVGLAATGDGRRLVTGDYEGVVRVWDLKTGRVQHHFSIAQKGYTFVATHPHEDVIAVAGPGQVSLHELDGTRKTTLEVPVQGVYSVAFDPTGSWLANAAADGKVRLWHTAALG